MPEPFIEWDLNLLAIFNGRAPAAHVVAAWLEALYWYQGGQHAPKTLQEALPVLRLSDSVGSPAGFMNALVDRIVDNWFFKVRAPPRGSDIRLPLPENAPWYVVVKRSAMPHGFWSDSAICSTVNSP
jgi:hypothetical protein